MQSELNYSPTLHLDLSQNTEILGRGNTLHSTSHWTKNQSRPTDVLTEHWTNRDRTTGIRTSTTRGMDTTMPTNSEEMPDAPMDLTSTSTNSEGTSGLTQII